MFDNDQNAESPFESEIHNNFIIWLLTGESSNLHSIPLLLAIIFLSLLVGCQ